jgi:uncharacterized protein involved in outer membrane biogenesis
MRKVLKFVGFLTLVCVLFVVVVSAAFYYLIREGEVRRFLISEIEQKTQLKIQLGDSDLEIGRILGVRFRDVTVSEPDGDEPAIQAESVTARVALLPLLERKLIFYEIRLHRGSVRVVRGKDGKIPLLDRLVNLPFLKNNDSQFALDLRAIKIADGEVEFYDYFTEETPVSTRLRNVNLDLDRISGIALREFIQNAVQAKPEQSRSPALNFVLRAGLEREGKQAKVSAKGTMVFPGERLEIQNVWWNAETWAADIPAPLIQAYLGRRLAVKSVDGMLNSQLHVEGNLKERLHIKGALAFKNLMADAPGIFSGPLAPGNGRLELDLNWQPQRWNLLRANFRSQELTLELKSVLSWAKDADPQIQLSVVTPFLSIAVIKKYLPAAWLDSPRIEGLLAALQRGDLRLTRAGASSRFSEISQMAKTGFDERVWFDAELRDVQANFPGGYLPVHEVQGRMTLEKGLFSFKGLSGTYGQSRLTNIDGTYRFATPGQESLELHAGGEVELAELREQLRQSLSPASVKVISSIQEMIGRGKFDIVVSQTAEAAPEIEGKIMLDGARLQVNDFSLSEIQGNLDITPREIKGEKVRALLSGSPVQIQLALQDYADDNGSFDLLVDSPGVKAGVVTRLLLATGSLQDPGIVRGSVRYQGAFATRAGRKFTGNLELANVQLATLPLLQPLTELNGRVEIDDVGIDFQNLRGLLVGFPAHFNGRWRYAQKPQLVFDFASPDLDLTYLLSQIEPESSDFYANLQAEGRITLAKGRVKDLEFADFQSDVVIDRRVWRLSNSTVRSAGGSIQGVGIIVDKPDTLEFNVTPKIQRVPVSTFLKWLDVSNADMTGRVNLTGNLESVGKDGAERRRNLNGSFNLTIEDGAIHRLRILIQILNLLDLSRWFTLKLPDLSKQGIRFRKITGDFKVANGVYSTDNLVVDSDDLRMTGAGKINVPKDEIDFVVAVRPFAALDTAINYIPLIGRGIAAIKNSFLVASFNVTGSVDRPTITPAPLSTLSEVFLSVLGIPNDMLGFAADGKNKLDEAINEAPKEKRQENSPEHSNPQGQ